LSYVDCRSFSSHLTLRGEMIEVF